MKIKLKDITNIKRQKTWSGHMRSSISNNFFSIGFLKNNIEVYFFCLEFKKELRDLNGELIIEDFEKITSNLLKMINNGDKETINLAIQLIKKL